MLSEIEAVRDTVNRRKRSPQSDEIAEGRLRSLVERIERLNSDRDDLTSDVKDIFTEAKSAGFDVKVLRKLIVERKKDPDKLAEEESLLDLYRREVG